MVNNIKLEQLNREEALRYLGYQHGEDNVEERMKVLIDECEVKVIQTARPAYVYKVFDVKHVTDGVELMGTNLVLKGESISAHLKGCQKAVLMAVTVGSDIDRVIRVTQLEDMAKAVIVDSLASVAVEQVCDKVEHMITEDYSEYYTTFRYGVGYGDWPIAQQRDVVNVLNAGKIIGLNVTESSMLTPTKSVTAVIGLSDELLEKRVRGCVTCNMKHTCQFRKKGGRCNE